MVSPGGYDHSRSRLRGCFLLSLMTHDVAVESRKTLKFVIPAKAGIQSFQGVEQNHITRFRRKRDFLQ
ncbi:MAG: hypothetical protein EA399_05145 [Desulfovibrionales bacterium]|nr:MAG: hypothetical protein EA399_05145 [Desulfovibrionales bacterium]